MKQCFPVKQNICITFIQCWTNIANVGPTLYKCLLWYDYRCVPIRIFCNWKSFTSRYMCAFKYIFLLDYPKSNAFSTRCIITENQFFATDQIRYTISDKYFLLKAEIIIIILAVYASARCDARSCSNGAYSSVIDQLYVGNSCLSSTRISP